MAGRYRAPGAPSTTTQGRPGKAAHAVGATNFAGTELSVDGVTRDAMGAASLLGTSIPKGPLAAALGASHGAAGNTLATNQSLAQVDIATVLAEIAAISASRSFRATARNAEAEAASATPLSVESPRLLAHGRGPIVSVMGMIPGDVNRTVAMFERYGYTINRAFAPVQLNAMSKFTYWRTDGAQIQGSTPQEKRRTIAQAFDRGVTVWTNIADIGTDVTSTNTPLPGISY